MMSDIEVLHPTNLIHEKLDDAISSAILEIVEKHNVSNSDIAGVMECIKFRILNSGEIERD